MIIKKLQNSFVNLVAHYKIYLLTKKQQYIIAIFLSMFLITILLLFNFSLYNTESKKVKDKILLIRQQVEQVIEENKFLEENLVKIKLGKIEVKSFNQSIVNVIKNNGIKIVSIKQQNDKSFQLVFISKSQDNLFEFFAEFKQNYPNYQIEFLNIKPYDKSDNKINLQVNLVVDKL